jgi:hemerythrin
MPVIRGNKLAYRHLSGKACGGLTDIFNLRYAQMPLLGWLPEYSVNEANLDNGHKKLFHILNTMYENIMNSEEVDCVLPVIGQLSDYTRYHFSEEEQYMNELGFKDINAHIAEHREFRHKIEELKSHYNGNNLEVTKELIIILGGWLLHHVIKEDKKYSGTA